MPGIYDVDWYDTYSDPPQYIATISNISPTIQVLPGPTILNFITPFFVPNDCKRQEYAFKIHPSGQMRANHSNSENSEQIQLDTVANIQYSNEIKQNSVAVKNFYDVFPNKCTIYPNPGTGIYEVQMLYEDDYLLEVINAYGAIVKTTPFKGKYIKVNIENLNQGIYTFNIRSKQGLLVQKIVKD